DDSRREADQTQQGDPDHPHRLCRDHADSPCPSRYGDKLLTTHEEQNAAMKGLSPIRPQPFALLSINLFAVRALSRARTRADATAIGRMAQLRRATFQRRPPAKRKRPW